MTLQLWLLYSDDISHLLAYELVYRIFITLSTLPLIEVPKETTEDPIKFVIMSRWKPQYHYQYREKLSGTQTLESFVEIVNQFQLLLWTSFYCIDPGEHVTADQ